MSASSDVIKSVLRFSNYVVNEIIFTVNPGFNKEDPIPISFDMDKNIVFDEENNSATVTLVTKIFENAKDNNYPFEFKIVFTGSFHVENIKNEQERIMIETNAIAILFPYIRALITSFTANANVQPLILPPINVVKFMQDKTKKLQN